MTTNNKEECSNCKFREGIRCKRNAPVIHPNLPYESIWPSIKTTDWCGQFEWKRTHERTENSR